MNAQFAGAGEIIRDLKYSGIARRAEHLSLSQNMFKYFTTFQDFSEFPNFPDHFRSLQNISEHKKSEHKKSS